MAVGLWTRWNQGSEEGFSRIAADDELATSPGDVLRELMNEYGPSLILIDEWVAYARQLHDNRDLPGGDFRDALLIRSGSHGIGQSREAMPTCHQLARIGYDRLSARDCRRCGSGRYSRTAGP